MKRNNSEIDERRSRTLYVRLPFTIRDPEHVRNLFSANVEVKLPRQKMRSCHVLFPTIEDKNKALEEVKNKTINNKRIVARILNAPGVKTKIKKPEKKIVVPEPKPERTVTRALHVSNINKNSTIADLKKVFEDVQTIVFINQDNSLRAKEAIVKLTDCKATAEYLKRDRPWPRLHGNKLIIKPDKRKHRRRKGKNSLDVQVKKKEDEIGIKKEAEEEDKDEAENVGKKKVISRTPAVDSDQEVEIKEEPDSEED